MSQVDENTEDKIIQWVTFHLADEVYGISVMQVMEVLRCINITEVPGAPAYVLGIINLRGNVVTVIDARTKFSLPKKEINDLTRIIIIEAEGHVLGMLVDCVTEVVYLKESEIDLPPNIGSDEGSRYIQGVHSDKELLILIDVNKLLTEQEWNDSHSM